jgi:very-short-patch-repair endonuclease
MKKEIIPYNPKLKALAKKLRETMTVSETMLWNGLKQKQLGFDFDRQKPIDEYIVDFYCKKLNLAIEIDGESHDHPDAYVKDLERQQRLETLGVHFLRFDDRNVKENINNVLDAIADWIDANKKKSSGL